MKITLKPVTDENREAVLKLSVREDQPFVATNKRSLEQAKEANAERPGIARPFAIYADGILVGFVQIILDHCAEDSVDRYWIWRFMIDKNEQGKGYGQAALSQIIDYFRDNGADEIYLSTKPENEGGLYIYHKAGFKDTGEMLDDEMMLKLTLL